MKIDPRRPLAVMYHYVWPADTPVPGGIRPIHASAFEAQLDALSERYDIVGADAFLERLDETSDRPPCLLTFDDGTRDHATVVTPILVRRGLSGVFFIISDPARGRLMPTTHLVHRLLNDDDDRVWAKLAPQAGDVSAATQVYRYESPTRARIKYALNMAMPPAAARAFALSMLDEDETTLARRWFADESQLRAMRDAGMTLAIHGRTHSSLQHLGPAIADEMADCTTFLQTLTGERPRWWACPFGGAGASGDAHAAMREAMHRLSIRAAVSTVAGSVPSQCDRLALPRVDCATLEG